MTKTPLTLSSVVSQMFVQFLVTLLVFLWSQQVLIGLLPYSVCVLTLCAHAPVVLSNQSVWSVVNNLAGFMRKKHDL